MVKPAGKRAVARWAERAFEFSERRACRLIGIARSTQRYRSRSDPQTALRRRLRELAASRVRWGYRRLTVLLRREGWKVNAKRIYRLYTEEGLTVTRPKRKKLARNRRRPQPPAERVNQRWAMDFVADRLVDGRRFRVWTLVDLFSRECLALYAERSITGRQVAAELNRVLMRRAAPDSITVDNGPEFASRALEAWSEAAGVELAFIAPGRPIENAFIESFNGRLRDEFLNVEVLLDMTDLRSKLERWRSDYNKRRPHSALGDQTPEEFVRSSKSQPGASTGFPDGGPYGAVPHSLPAASPCTGGDPDERRKTPALLEALSLAELGLSRPLDTESRIAQSRKSSP